MKLLYVHNADFSKPEANKVQVTNMCHALRKIGVNLTLMGYNNSNEKISKYYTTPFDYKTIILKSESNYYMRTLKLFRQFIKLKRDVDNIYTRDMMFALLVSFFFKKKKVIYELHEIHEKFLWKLLLKLTLKYVKNVVIVGEGVKTELKKRKYNITKIKVIPNAFNIEVIDIKISKEDARMELDWPKDKIIVSYTGSSLERDLDTLFSVAKMNPAIQFYLYGSKQSELKNIPDNVFLKSFTKQPGLIGKASDILFAGYNDKIMSQFYDISFLKIYELLASKRPFIISDFSLIRKQIGKGYANYYPSGDVEILNLILRKLIKHLSKYQKESEQNMDLVRENTYQARARKVERLFS
ncbi:MAG: glycosyltransferase [Candidatus Nanoarchaeia archaeon]|nr:glycosyltransferase [Candidatus Nanoarchaeia archaeon]